MSEDPRSYEIRATSGWPPVRIPGRPGWWRHCIDDRQVDLPHRESPAADTSGQHNQKETSCPT
jgi:hypothetical protein